VNGVLNNFVVCHPVLSISSPCAIKVYSDGELVKKLGKQIIRGFEE
jgi:hypothetical protein